MRLRELSVPGAFEVTPRVHADDRGVFLEWYRFDHLGGAVGHPLTLAQANHSVSVRGTLRGVHYADVPPGQAKYVYCSGGAVLDVVVDLRVGSPAFGRHEAVRLDDVDRRAVYLPEGVGHAFMALSERASVSYLCSSTHAPDREHGVHPLDAGLDLPWPNDVHPLLSPKDAAAPGLAEALAAGALPRWADCLAFAHSLETATPDG